MRKFSVQSAPFIATRQHHDVELAEDYVEVLADLINIKAEAKACDLALHFAVSHVTVMRNLKRLRTKNLVFYNNRQPILLTEEGLKLALACKTRHQFLLRYLIALGVSEETAAIDAEGMEHHISKSTLDAMQRHLNDLLKVSGTDNLKASL